VVVYLVVLWPRAFISPLFPSTNVVGSRVEGCVVPCKCFALLNAMTHISSAYLIKGPIYDANVKGVCNITFHLLRRTLIKNYITR
jgi:hypothetical protein